MKFNRLIIVPAIAAVSLSVSAQKGVTVHGSVQSDILFPEEDYKIGTES